MCVSQYIGLYPRLWSTTILAFSVKQIREEIRFLFGAKFITGVSLGTAFEDIIANIFSKVELMSTGR